MSFGTGVSCPEHPKRRHCSAEDVAATRVTAGAAFRKLWEEVGTRERVSNSGCEEEAGSKCLSKQGTYRRGWSQRWQTGTKPVRLCLDLHDSSPDAVWAWDTEQLFDAYKEPASHDVQGYLSALLSGAISVSNCLTGTNEGTWFPLGIQN